MCRLGTAGRAVVPVKLPLGGPELLRDCCPWVNCSLHLTYLGHRYPASAAPTTPLFDPPLALQRHALVAGTPSRLCKHIPRLYYMFEFARLHVGMYNVATQIWLKCKQA